MFNAAQRGGVLLGRSIQTARLYPAQSILAAAASAASIRSFVLLSPPLHLRCLPSDTISAYSKGTTLVLIAPLHSINLAATTVQPTCR